MNVVVLGRFPPPVDGQTMATRRVAELLRTHHDVHEINTEPPDTGFVAADVTFRPRRVVHYLSSMARLRSELARARDAVVLWTSISPAPLGHWRDMLAVLPTFARGQRVFGVVHRASFHELFASPVTRATGAALVRRLDGFVFLDDTLAAQNRRWIPEPKLRVIPNTIDDAMSCSDGEVAARQLVADRPFRLLFLSNMLPEKGYLDVLESVRRLLARGIAVRADFVGRWISADDRAAFERLVASSQLGTSITHHGGVTDRTAIRRLYTSADAFVLPTYHPTEAQPLTILEALSAGTPVITTVQGGIGSIVRAGESACIVPARDPQAIADAVDTLRAPGRWKAMSVAARKRFVEAFSPDRVRAQWEVLIGQVEPASSRIVT